MNLAETHLSRRVPSKSQNQNRGTHPRKPATPESRQVPKQSCQIQNYSCDPRKFSNMKQPGNTIRAAELESVLSFVIAGKYDALCGAARVVLYGTKRMQNCFYWKKLRWASGGAAQQPFCNQHLPVCASASAWGRGLTEMVSFIR